MPESAYNETDRLMYSMFIEWKRLHGFNKPETGIEMLIDSATGREERLMTEFSKWFFTDILPRLKVDSE